MQEIWKDIEGYKGLYQVSNLGRIKALGNGDSNASKERILKLKKRKDGYLDVGLCKLGKEKKYKVHRLVGMAFISNPNNYLEINHKNEIKSDNRADNLEYCDRKYNVNYGTRNEKVSKKVLCVETGVVYNSAHQIERELRFDNSSISRCCNGKQKTSYGYRWRFVEKETRDH